MCAASTRRSRPALRALASAALLPLAALAQEGAPVPNRVVVSASGLPLTEAMVNQNVSVYTRDDIERFAPASLSEFLVQRAGVTIDREPRSGGFGSLFLRGADPSHVVVLIDGIRQNDPLSSRGSAVDLNTLTLDDVERIEIVRGSSAVVHPEALAGVVQIFRLARSESPLVLRAETGGDRLAAAAATAALGPWRASVTQRQEGDADDIGFSRNRAANLGFRGRWGGTGLNVQLRVGDSKNLGFPDDSGGPRYARNRSLEERRADTSQLAVAFDRDLGNDFTLEGHAARFQRNSAQNTPAVAPGLRDPLGLPAAQGDGRYVRTDAQANLRWHRSDGLDLLLGASTQIEQGDLDSTLVFFGRRLPASFQRHRVTNGVVAEARKSFGDFSVQAGLRHERAAGEETLNHPSVSAQYQLPGSGVRVGGALSSASKLPSFYALGDPLVGNPNLRSERSRQAEVYVDAGDAWAWKGRLTLFQANFKDLVDFDPGPPPRLVNRASIRSRGVELNVNRSWREGMSVYAQGTLLNIRQPEGDPPLRFRPRHQMSAGVELPVAPRWRVNTAVSYVGRRFDSSIPTGDVELGGYTVFNVGATWAVPHWKVFVAVDNLLDHRADEAIGTPVVERRLRVGLRWEL
ncbi:TonB-dependent receptor [Oxalobacteraceae bacterium OM1]|nr:TonB-dependent receptor [Oxalobacteraceae bacterium OM1]